MTWEQIELFEEWRPVVGYEGYYEVSNWGRVRSVAKGKGRKTGKLLVQRAHIRDEYFSVILCRETKQKSRKTHALVAEAFIGRCPFGKQIDHIDGNRQNNVVPNLRYVTQLENRRAAVRRRGEWAVNSMPPPPMYGKDNPAAKLTRDQVLDIRRLVIEGMTQRAVAKEFGVSTSAVWLIVHGKNHKRTT